MDISLPAVGKVRWKKFHILTPILRTVLTER
jgi:hypothetical protein